MRPKFKKKQARLIFFKFKRLPRKIYMNYLTYALNTFASRIRTGIGYILHGEYILPFLPFSHTRAHVGRLLIIAVAKPLHVSSIYSLHLSFICTEFKFPMA